MPEIINCPECQRQLRLPEEMLGKKVKCPSCGVTFTASGPPGAETAPPPAPTADEEPWANVGESAAPPEEEEEEAPRRRRRRSRRDDDDDEDDEDRGRPYKTPDRGSTILVLGILSLFILPIILGPIAWTMANNDLREMRLGRMDRAGEGNTNAGRICGIIGTSLGLLGFVCCCGYFMLVGMFAGAGAQHGRF